MQGKGGPYPGKGKGRPYPGKGKGKGRPYPGKGKGGPRPTSRGKSKAIYVRENSPDLEIVSCDLFSVEVKGPLSANLTTGTFLLNLEGGDGSCSLCSPLFRKVTSVTTSSSGTKLLSTTFATVGEILGNLSGVAITNIPLEPIAGCSHSTGRADLFHDATNKAAMVIECDKEPCLLEQEEMNEVAELTSVNEPKEKESQWILVTKKTKYQNTKNP